MIQFFKTNTGETMNNPPAFPQHGWTNDPEILARMENGLMGMDLRDYFAGQALAGMFQSRELFNTIQQIKAGFIKGGMDPKQVQDQFEFPVYAKASYAIADAMLAAREQQHKP